MEQEYHVKLTEEDRARLKGILRRKRVDANVYTRTLVLLWSDENGFAVDLKKICDLSYLPVEMVLMIQKEYALNGLDNVLVIGWEPPAE
ncbi:MAG: hypothetical protein LBT59_29570 [Clostridiales bacterium]|nr:hypothetical protein [Clostridiales bacterium]